MVPGEKIESVLSHATPIDQYKMQTADWVQNANLVVWYVTACHLKTYFPVFRDLAVSSYSFSLTKRPGHRLFISCIPDLPTELPISEWAAMLPNAKIADDPRLTVVLC